MLLSQLGYCPLTDSTGSFSFSNIFCIPALCPARGWVQHRVQTCSRQASSPPCGIMGLRGQHVSKTGVKHKPRSVLQGQGTPLTGRSRNRREAAVETAATGPSHWEDGPGIWERVHPPHCHGDHLGPSIPSPPTVHPWASLHLP